MLASKDEVEPMSEETAQEFNKMLNKYRGGILKDIENYLKLNVMNKDEAIEKLRRAESELRQAEIVMEMHENGVRELREDIAKLESKVQHLEAELRLWKPIRGEGGKFVKKSLTTQTV